MKTLYKLALVLIVFILLVWFSPARHPSASPMFLASIYPHAEVVIGPETFDAVIADSEARKEQGLSGWSGLGMHEAMIFPYDVPKTLPFWMKGMLFSIDILWLDTNLRVVYFEKGLSPDSYPKTFGPDDLAQYVIELPAGTLDRLHINIGDSISISPKK